MTDNHTPIDPRPDDFSKRVYDSVQRDDLPLDNDRSRLRFVMNNLILHIHPAKVSKRSLKFTYTWGLGGLSIMLLTMLVATGILLMFVYTPTPETAYNDMLALQTDVMFGQAMRNLHHWSGNLMVIVVFLHLLRVFFTGGFRPPREFNWVMGVVLLILTVGANFTGYLLPWDQRAYWAVTVGASLLSYVPLVGAPVGNFLLGGPEVSGSTLTNFYGLHVAIIPMIIFFIASFHIWRVRKDGLTEPRNIAEEKKARVEKVTTIPNLVTIELAFALVIFAALFFMAVFVNAPLEPAADPTHSPNPAKAAWYFMGIQELLLHFHPVFGAIVLPSVILLGITLYPYMRFDSDADGIWFRSNKGRVMAWVSVVVALIVTPLWVIADEFWLDLPAMFPTLPTIVSNGWLPFMVMLFGLLAYDLLMKAIFRATYDEAHQSLFVLLIVGFVILTVIGVFFRGEGMALMYPWEVLE